MFRKDEISRKKEMVKRNGGFVGVCMAFVRREIFTGVCMWGEKLSKISKACIPQSRDTCYL